MLYAMKHYNNYVLGSYLMSYCIVCIAIDVSTRRYMVVSVILCERWMPPPLQLIELRRCLHITVMLIELVYLLQMQSTFYIA